MRLTLIGIALIASGLIESSSAAFTRRDCNSNERCISIYDCPKLMAIVNDRNANKKNLLLPHLCGLYSGTIDHCCPIDATTTTTTTTPRTTTGRTTRPSRPSAKTRPPTPAPTPMATEEPTVGPTRSSSIVPHHGSIENHRNIGLINHKRCGDVAEDRMIGAEVANIYAFRWMTLLQYQSTTDSALQDFLCGGTLISESNVLTAAHCIEVKSYMLIGVRLGEHTISSDQDCNNEDDCQNDQPQDFELSGWIVHTGYDRQKKINDIALVHLKQPAQLIPRFISTICLPVMAKQKFSKILNDLKGRPFNMTAAGWGTTETGRSSDSLMFADLPYVDKEECERIYTEELRTGIRVQDSHICAGGLRSDTAKGDSGGPLMHMAELKKSARYFQYGIVSIGIKVENNQFYPGVYTKVDHFMMWILDNLKA